MAKYIVATEVFGNSNENAGSARHIGDDFCECASLAEARDEVDARTDLAENDVEENGKINILLCRVLERCNIKKSQPTVSITRRKG